MAVYSVANVISETEATCTLPRISRPGSVHVEITFNGIDYTHD